MQHHRPNSSAPPWHPRGLCGTCGREAPVERHHVAGRKFSPATLSLCWECHDSISAMQRAVLPVLQEIAGLHPTLGELAAGLAGAVLYLLQTILCILRRYHHAVA